MNDILYNYAETRDMGDYCEKELILRDFIDKYMHLPEQGTDEWKKSRKLVGGSSIAVFDNSSGFGNNIFKWCKEKLDIEKKYIPAINCRFGHCFEDVTVRAIKQLWGVNLYETGAIPHTHPEISYSPDGLVVVDKFIVDKYVAYSDRMNNLVKIPSKTDNICHATHDKTNDICHVTHDKTNDICQDMNASEIQSQMIEGNRYIKELYELSKFIKQTALEINLLTKDIKDIISLQPLQHAKPSDPIEGGKNIILMEFKCPPKNRPTGVIPSYYMAQVLSGMCVIPLCEYAIFVNSMYRICRGVDVGWNKFYNKQFHNKDVIGTGRNLKIVEVGIPLMYGFIGVYEISKTTITEEEYEKMINDPIERQFKCNIMDDVDWGDVDIKDLEKMFEKEQDGVFKFRHSKTFIRNFVDNDELDKENPDEMENPIEMLNKFKIAFKKEIQNDNVKNIRNKIDVTKIYRGVMCYKSFKMDFIKQEKQPDFINNIIDKIDAAVKIVKTVGLLPLGQRYEALCEYFPEEKAKNLEYAQNNEVDYDQDRFNYLIDHLNSNQ